MDLLRNTSSGEVFTRDELRARLTAELNAMDPETRGVARTATARLMT